METDFNTPKLDIKKYLNIYQFLQDYYNFRKSNEKKFSFELWSQELSLTDKSYLRMMVHGKRTINEKMVGLFLENLDLSEDSKLYFQYLVLYTQSKTHEQKKIFGQKLISLLKTELDQTEINNNHQFLTNPLLPRLQVLLSFSDLDQSYKNLAWLLNANEKEVENALNQLISLKLIENYQSRYVPIKKSFKISDNYKDIGLETFYLKNLSDSKEAIQKPYKDRRFKSMLLPMNEAEFELYLENLNNFTKEQLKIFNSDYFKDRKLYQVHFNIIPVTEKSDSLPIK